MIKSIFYCSKCDLKFEDTGFKIFWRDKIYGTCWKRSAICPKCKKQVDEYFSKSRNKKNESNNIFNNSGSCGISCGCCQ